MINNLLKSKHLLIYIVVFSFLIRLISLNQSFWMDEAISATVASNFTISSIVSKYIVSDTHPPLYYLIMRIWSLTFGLSELSLRLPSVFFGVLTVYLVYKIGKLYKKRIAVLSSILLATAPLHIYYSQEARMYSLTTFLVALCIYLFLRKKWKVFSVALVLLGASDYLPLSILLPLWLFSLIKFNKKEIQHFFFAQLPLATLFFVWLPKFVTQGRSTTQYLLKFPQWRTVLGGGDLKNLILVWVKFLIGRVSFDDKYLYGILIITVTAPFLYLLTRLMKEVKKGDLIWFWFLIPIVATFLISLRVPGFSYFRLLFVLPAFYILVSRGIEKTNKKNFFTAFILSVNLIFSSVYLFNSKYWREDWKSLVSFVENRIEKDEIVLVSYFEPFTPYIWYSEKKDKILTFNHFSPDEISGIYSLDYLMDLTDPERSNFRKLTNLGFSQKEVYNFRGTGQVRYWTKN